MSQVSTEIDANYVAGKLKEWSEKSNTPVDELKTKYSEILAKTEGRTDAIKYKKALTVLLRTFTTSMRSTAISYQTIIVGLAQPFDFARTPLENLQKKYKLTPSECIASGEVVLHGDMPVFMDTNKLFKSGKENFNYGKPLPEHNWSTTCYAVTKKPNEDQKWMPATIALRGQLATADIPLFKEMNIRLNGTYSGAQSRYLLNSSAVTDFEGVVRDVPSEEIVELVDTVFANKLVLPKQLAEEHEQTKDNAARFIVTEATLNRHYINETGISTIEIIDESLDFGETIVGFVDPNISSMLEDLKDGTPVGVICRTTMVADKDPETKEKTGEYHLGMNVFSVFERPE